MTNDVGGMLYVFSGSLDVLLSQAFNKNIVTVVIIAILEVGGVKIAIVEKGL